MSHEFPRQDVRAAAFWLREILPYFPPAVHLVVVDPGVGTDRDALVLRAGDHAFVAPDNGVVMPAARALTADDHRVRAWRIEDEDAESSTFHGRDVFAPAAGDVHRLGIGDYVEQVGATPVDGFVDLELPDADVTESGATGEVVTVDDFGNVVTNVPGRVLEGVESVRVNDREVPAVSTFADVPAGQWLATVGSHGYVECDVNQGRGDRAFGLETGDTVVVDRVE